ncbi:hypothetical protein GCM10010517_80260 [Streptosporangium fragile]|uniref:Uncharacterized protein n=1 Tax=Streptosporangium fragile TaxID=46186 RepID=A0ABN3WFR4_9ACTN
MEATRIAFIGFLQRGLGLQPQGETRDGDTPCLDGTDRPVGRAKLPGLPPGRWDVVPVQAMSDPAWVRPGGRSPVKREPDP